MSNVEMDEKSVGFSTITQVNERQVVADFIQLTKPRIALLVLLTTYTGMWLANGGAPDWVLVWVVLLGTGLASAGSCTLNNYVDRDVDKLMARTRHRALPEGRIEPLHALYYGLFLSVSGVLILLIWANLFAALLALTTILFYVFVYTIWLKRTSSLCTEIGGVAGALPVVIGWVAVTDTSPWSAFALFAVMFLWQPPHFWALALIRADEYKAAGLFVLPVTHGEQVTKKRMMLYTMALLPSTVAVFLLGIAGTGYLLVSTLMGIVYLLLTVQFIREQVTQHNARRLFGFSIVYLLTIFVAMFLDSQPVTSAF